MEKTCLYCGKIYDIPKSQENRSKYCSDECFRKSKRNGEYYNCDNCGKEFYIPKFKIDKKKNGKIKDLTCSKECAIQIKRPDFNNIRSLFNSKNYILLSTEYIDAKSKLEYICKIHEEYGSQFISYDNIRNGNGCKFCGIDRTCAAKRNDYEKVKNAFDKKDLILLDQEYRNAHQLLKYICKNHIHAGIQEMSYTNVKNNGCPLCDQSKGEQRVRIFLEKNDINFVQFQKYDELIGIGGRRLSYDFYLVDYNILIEYQGQYHDGTARNQNKEDFEKQQEHDRLKRNYAKNNSIELLEIWYYDFKNIDKILKKKLFNIPQVLNISYNLSSETAGCQW